MSRTVAKYTLYYDDSASGVRMIQTLDGSMERPSKRDLNALKKITAVLRSELICNPGSTVLMEVRVDGKLVFSQSFDESDIQ